MDVRLDDSMATWEGVQKKTSSAGYPAMLTDHFWIVQDMFEYLIADDTSMLESAKGKR